MCITWNKLGNRLLISQQWLMRCHVPDLMFTYYFKNFVYDNFFPALLRWCPWIVWNLLPSSLMFTYFTFATGNLNFCICCTYLTVYTGPIWKIITMCNRKDNYIYVSKFKQSLFKTIPEFFCAIYIYFVCSTKENRKIISVQVRQFFVTRCSHSCKTGIWFHNTVDFVSFSLT